MTAPIPPGGPRPEGAPRRSSNAGYWAAAAIFVVGGFAAVLWLGIVALQALGAPDGYERMVVPGRMELELDAGDWVLYHEYAGASSSRALPSPELAVEAPSGEEVQLFTPSTSFDYDIGGHEGTAIAEFHASTSGTYAIDALADPPGSGGRTTLAVGRPFSPSWWQLLAALALGAASVMVAFVVVVVTLVRHGRARRIAGGGPDAVPGGPGGSAPAPPPVPPPSPWSRPARAPSPWPRASEPPPADPSAPDPRPGPPPADPPAPDPRPGPPPAEGASGSSDPPPTGPPASWPRSWPDRPPERGPDEG